MRHYGLPEIIRVDNGTPFASNSLAGLSQLSIWWIEQGIRVEFTTPASPQENGSHERMHRDLKAEATKPPSKNMLAQRKRLERWRSEYNTERPHESLDMLRPAEIYRKSARRLGEKVKMRYPEGHQIKRVSGSGHISYGGRSFYLSEISSGCQVSVYENASGVSELHYSNLHIGNLEYDFEDPYRPECGKWGHECIRASINESHRSGSPDGVLLGSKSSSTKLPWARFTGSSPNNFAHQWDPVQNLLKRVWSGWSSLW